MQYFSREMFLYYILLLIQYIIHGGQYRYLLRTTPLIGAHLVLIVLDYMVNFNNKSILPSVGVVDILMKMPKGKVALIGELVKQKNQDSNLWQLYTESRLTPLVNAEICFSLHFPCRP